MILVLLGTQDNSFIRLLNSIQECVNKEIIKEEVIIQSGNTKFTSDNMQVFDFVSESDLNNMLKRADLIISHGGVGSVLNAAKLGKKIIAVPRLKKYKEHVNDHQIQLVKSLEKYGYILGLYNIEDMEDVLKRIKDFKPKTYISNNEKLIQTVTDYIDNN